jgi:citrate lyase beta subunit
MALKLMYITNSPDVALIAEKYGVDRIWIDLETLGKEERQKGMNSVISHHSIADIAKIKPLLTRSEMLVRVNPINPNSKQEIDDVIKAGADIVMLPMWKDEKDVKTFLRYIGDASKPFCCLRRRKVSNVSAKS